ncbi:MAG: DNA methyltransferase, partial [Candidatus Aenigmatarchaeota archaeon]
MKIENMPELQDLVTFRPNLKHPVHRWFYYKEAFSRDLVNIILKEFRPKTVLDPFCGTGTTLLACAEKGIDSIGFDVNPIAIIASRAKTMIYNTEVLRQEKERVFSEKFSETRLVENRLERYFTKETLKRLVFNKSLANKTKYNDFFLLALANAAYECSNVVRDGAMLRHSSKRFIPIRAVFGRNMETMWRDLKKIKLTGKAHVMEADARKIPLKDHS